MRDYSNKKVFIGIDVHKKSYSVTAICEGQVVKKDKLYANPDFLIVYCKKYFQGATVESAYETGFCGFFLHRALEAKGIKNHVIHAAGIEIAVGDKVKTDKRDSLKLATQLSTGRLKGVNVPTKKREDYRALTRMRETFIGHRRRIACQLKSMLFLQGLIPFDHSKVVSEKWIKSLSEMAMTAEIREVVDEYAQMWLHITSRIKSIEEKIGSQAIQDERLEMVYRSVPGIGPVVARALANELGDTLQFNNERQLFSFVGLTPSEYSSGEHKRQGHISRQGSAFVRKLLVQVAWKAIKLDPSLQEDFERIAVRAGKKRAIVGIARRIIGRIRACFKHDTLYCTGKEDLKLAI